MAAEFAAIAQAKVAVVVVEVVAPGKSGSAAGARGVLPLCLAGHVIRIVTAALPVEPADELLRIVPAHAHCGTHAAAEVAIFGVGASVRALPQRLFNGRVL